MIMKPPRRFSPPPASSTSPPPPPPPPPPLDMQHMHLRRPCSCTSATLVCLLLILASCALLAYSAFFSDLQLQYFPSSCTLCPSAPLFNNPFPNPSSHPIPTLHVHGPAPPPTDLSHILFAIGASANTWHQRRAYTQLWWRPNLTRGHVWLDQPPTAPWPSTSPPYRISHDKSRYGNRASASRIAALVVEAYQLVLSSSSVPEKESVRWFVMGDDDTVFFLENLVAVLQKYDHRQMYYVGMPSESVEQDVMHSYGMAFGGGGFAISYPAAAELARVMDSCLDRYASFYGSDQRVQACLAELGIPLTREPGFHQVDVRGDVYGILAAHPLAPLVSLHHLDYVDPIIPKKPSQLDALQSLFSAYHVDPARILQQAFCYDMATRSVLSVSVSWGYTVQVYPWVVTPHDLETPLQTFKTWRSFSDGPFIFNTRPLGDACNRPTIFFLDGVLQNQTDASVTQYTRQAHGASSAKAKCMKGGLSAAASIEKVRVFAPKMDPSMCKQAPRRHCCMMRRTKWGRLLEVGIKYCSPGESLLN